MKEKKPIYKKWWFYLIIFLVIGGLGNLASGSNNKDKDSTVSKPDQTETKSEENEPQGDKVYSLGETIEYKDFTLTTSEKRIVDASYGDKSYIIIDVTIVSKKDDLSFTGNIQGVKGDNEVINPEYVILTDEELGDPITSAWTKTMNTDQKVSGYIAFNTSDDVQTIEITTGFISKETIKISLD